MNQPEPRSEPPPASQSGSGSPRSSRPSPSSSKDPDWDLEAGWATNAARALPQWAAQFFAAGRQACSGDLSPGTLHRLRLAGKRFRYSLELFRDCYGPELEARLASLKAIQNCLGQISDCDATERLVRAEPSASGSDSLRFMVFLADERRARVAAFLAFWRDTFDAPGEETAWAAYLANCGEETPRPGSAT